MSSNECSFDYLRIGKDGCKKCNEESLKYENFYYNSHSDYYYYPNYDYKSLNEYKDFVSPVKKD